MTKRSPILGYNHNVRYRGLVFHVQTEDSGVLSPHLFTHLFHHGVIVSTRKLVYDAGSAEDAIKGLMQAQHKVVLKELKRGQFDDKIDAYLGGTPGLLPRGVKDEGDISATNPETPIGLGTLETPIADAETTDPGVPEQPEQHDIAITFKPTVQMAPHEDGTPEITFSDENTPSEPIPPAVDLTMKNAAQEPDSSPEIEIIELENAAVLDEHTRPTVGSVEQEAARAVSDGVPVPRAMPPPLPTADPKRDTGNLKDPKRQTGDRPPSLAGATLPPARAISRPPSRPALPAMSPPQVVSRPLPPDERRSRETDAIEVYAAAPPGAELPAQERPGQYAQHKKSSNRIPTIKGDGRPGTGERAPVERPGTGERAAVERPGTGDRPGASPIEVAAKPGSAPIPAGLSRPRPPGTPPTPPPPTPPAANAAPAGAGAGTGPIPKHILREQSPSMPAPPPASQPVHGIATPRTHTPPRTSPPSGPATARTGTGASGVVMTRPAVIVGAPVPKPTQPRVRKAREEEGRGFGQGLISEKSLDEVILAYLSEDADEK